MLPFNIFPVQIHLGIFVFLKGEEGLSTGSWGRAGKIEGRMPLFSSWPTGPPDSPPERVGKEQQLDVFYFIEESFIFFLIIKLI